jgi:hypothetical protein
MDYEWQLLITNDYWWIINGALLIANESNDYKLL